MCTKNNNHAVLQVTFGGTKLTAWVSCGKQVNNGNKIIMAKMTMIIIIAFKKNNVPMLTPPFVLLTQILGFHEILKELYAIESICDRFPKTYVNYIW
jgi:hypothetical protein